MKRNVLTHQDVLNHICEHLEQKLNSPKCRAIKRHLDSCPNCTSYLKSIKTVLAFYKRYPIPKLSKMSEKRLFSLLQQVR